MPDYGGSGPFAVAVEDGEWSDGSRQRRLRWRRHHPVGRNAAPCVLYSHGLGGDRDSGTDWLHHWASWGLAAVVVQHPGTDATALASDSPLALRHLLRQATNPAELAERQADLRFMLDRLAGSRLEQPGAFAIAGHSYGAVSALRLIGERRGRNDMPADRRLAAAILFSPSARGGSLPLAERFAGVTLPCLHLTGSEDHGIGRGDIDVTARRLPFAHMPAGGQHLLVVAGATHRDLAGDSARHPAPAHASNVLRAASTAFLLEHLCRQQEAARWLRRGLPLLLHPADELITRDAGEVG